MKHEYKVDCARCGTPGAEWVEELQNPMCPACVDDIERDAPEMNEDSEDR